MIEWVTEPDAPTPTSEDHALLVGRIPGAVLMTNTSDEWAPAELVGVNTVDGRHSTRFYVGLPSGRYLVSIDKAPDT